MKVNTSKTQLLCISDNKTNSVTNSYIRVGKEKIVSGEELKILGFMFSRQPSVKCHVNYMVSKAKKKLWTLRHVKKAGLGQEDLLRTFNTLVRPTLEYAAPTFHSMLSAEMRDQIEYVQKRASKIIFGWQTHYDEIIASGKMVTLEERREMLTSKFEHKTSKNPRFADWFTKKDYENVDLRSKNKFVQPFARTERLRKSPVHYMTRLLNAD